MPTRLARELALLRRHLLDMSGHVIDQYTGAVAAILEQDLDKANLVIARDDEIDALEMEVDRHCERVLALHQPVAADLRAVIMAEKINTDLERIGDHCKNVARITEYVVDAPHILSEARFREMANASRQMLLQARQAFLSRDADLGRKILDYDETVDDLHWENFDVLVEHFRSHSDDVEVAAHLLMASKALERISDHATNIAKAVVFLIEGEDIRHSAEA
jgi:phosphate transport system protein